jgi:hypothetical protein
MRRSDRIFIPSKRFAQMKRNERSMRVVVCNFPNIEPRQKSSMSKSDKAKIQQVLLDTLKATRRRAFRGAVALRIQLCTTDKTPTQSHHVAKNLLDLFGTPTHVRTRRSALLYRDDRQVHALSVSATHGHDKPSIFIKAQSLTDFLEDVRLAADVEHERDQSFYYDEPGEQIDDFREMLADPDGWKRVWGDSEAGHALILRLKQKSAQEALFGQGALSIEDLDNMYSERRVEIPGIPDSREWFQDMFAALPLRIRLSPGCPKFPDLAMRGTLK